MLRSNTAHSLRPVLHLVSILGCITLVLFSGCVSTAIRQTDLYKEYYDQPIPPAQVSSSYAFESGTHVLELSGTAADIGRQYGEIAANLDIDVIYEVIFANAAAMLADDAPDEYEPFITVSQVKKLLLEAWEIMAPYTPQYVHEMLEAFAEASGIPYDDVKAIHAIPDFTETSCSALWATGDATVDGESVQIRVLDYIMGLGIQEYPAVVFMDFGQGHRVANIGWLGLLGIISGMNDSGLAVSEMGYGNPDGEHFHATPMPFVLLDVLRWADHPAEASGIIKSHPRTNSYVYIVGTARNGGLAFVTSAYEVDSFGPGETDAPVAQLPDMLHAGHYQERMDALVAEHHGEISAEWLMDEFIPEIAMKSNLQCVVYDLPNLRFHVANAPDGATQAAVAPYATFSFPDSTGSGR